MNDVNNLSGSVEDVMDFYASTQIIHGTLNMANILSSLYISNTMISSI